MGGASVMKRRGGAAPRALAAALAALLCLQALPIWAEGPAEAFAQAPAAAAEAELAAQADALLEAAGYGLPGEQVARVTTADELLAAFDRANTAGGTWIVSLEDDIDMEPPQPGTPFANRYYELEVTSCTLVLVGNGHTLRSANRVDLNVGLDERLNHIGLCLVVAADGAALHLGLPDGRALPDAPQGGGEAALRLIGGFCVANEQWGGLLSMGPGTVFDGEGTRDLQVGCHGSTTMRGVTFQGFANTGYEPRHVASNACVFELSDSGGPVIVEDCSFVEVAPRDGGNAIGDLMHLDLFDGDGRMADCEFIRCSNSGMVAPGYMTAQALVGVVVAPGGEVSLERVRFEGCAVTPAATEGTHYGLVMAMSTSRNPGTLRLADCEFEGNSMEGRGASLVLACVPDQADPVGAAPASLALEGCAFTGNAAERSLEGGALPQAGCVVASGLSATGATLSLSGCTFEKNTGSEISACVLADGVEGFSVKGCTFTDNVSDAGAALEASGSTGSIEDCTFTGNEATGDLAAPVSGGGALYVHNGSDVTMAGGEISGNSAQHHGGGVWLSGGARLAMTGVTVAGNATPRHGGGVSIPYKRSADEADTVLVMERCTVSGNTAGEFGGGVQAMSGAVELRGCTIEGNAAGDHGGGVWAESGLGHLPGEADPDAFFESPARVAVAGGSVAGNRAGDHAGGAGASQGAVLEMEGVGISGNRAGDHGGGVLSEGADSQGRPSEVVLTGCDVAGNFAAGHGGGLGVAAENVAAGGASDGARAAAPAGRMTVAGGSVVGNSTDGRGGGACAEPGGYLDLSAVRVYGNSAADAADGVNVRDGAAVLLGPAAAEALLPCGHAVDGWYYDGAGARWAALVNQDPPIARPLVEGEGVAYDADTGIWTVTAGDHALKDAHGPDPHLPGEEPPTGEEPSAGEGLPAGDGPAGDGPAPAATALPATGDPGAPAAASAAAAVAAALALAALSARRLRRAL